MLIQILHRDTRAVLYAGKHASIQHAVEAAVWQGLSLRDADLRGANLPAYQIPQAGELAVMGWPHGPTTTARG